MLKKKWQWKKVHIVSLLLLLYAGCLAVLSLIGYSDGDDTFFLEYCTSMSLPDYLSWRYENWTGRMIAEGLMHVFFNLDLWAWRIVNAGMLVALPVALAVLKNRVTGTTQDIERQETNGYWMLCFVMAALGYLFLDINAFGYSAIWITGSMNYLWPMVCGISALCVVAKASFSKEKVSVWSFVVASVGAIVAAMSSEQMGAVLLAFVIICISEKIWKKKQVQVGLAVLGVLTLGAYLVSALAPGNELRILMAIEHNMPQFEMLTLEERVFLLAQWLVSSFANENTVFLMAIWLLGIFILITRMKQGQINKNESRRIKLYIGTGSVFLGVGVISKCGVRSLSDIGINLAEMTGLVEQVPMASDMSMMQWLMFGWWMLAIVFTFFFLWEVSKGHVVLLFTYLGAVACEVIMIFSPTIYSSGERVFFLTGIMLMFIVLVLYEMLPKGKLRIGYVSTLVVIGVGNLVLQAAELLGLM